MIYRGPASLQRLCLIIGVLVTCTDADSVLYPFGTDVGDEMLPPKDDIRHVSLTQSFRFGGIWYDHLGICDNGLITFRGPFCSYYVQDFTNLHILVNIPMIAMFWDHQEPDQKPPGNTVYFRQTNDPDQLSQLTQDIRANGQPDCPLDATWAFVVTFYNVKRHDPWETFKLYNTYQAVLVSYGTQSIVLLRYEKLEWTDGTQVGITGGDGINYVELPGSRSEAVLDLVNQSNMGVPGSFIYRVDQVNISENNITCESLECICGLGRVRAGYYGRRLVRFDNTLGEVPFSSSQKEFAWIMVGRSWSHFDDPCRFHLRIIPLVFAGYFIRPLRVELDVGSNPDDPEDFETYFSLGNNGITVRKKGELRSETIWPPYEYNGVPHVKLDESGYLVSLESNDCPWKLKYDRGHYYKVTFQGPPGPYTGKCGACE